jgi:hypothetical protein
MPVIFILLLLPIVGYALHITSNRKVLGRIPLPFQTKPLQESEAAKKSGGRASQNYALLFPPSRHHALPDFCSDLYSPALHVDPQYTKLLPDKEAPNLSLHHDHSTATGITLREIQNLGDFPDYATLSGVPLPEPYLKFDIKKAMPRPYRPCRWAYHQTMGGYLSLDSQDIGAC